MTHKQQFAKLLRLHNKVYGMNRKRGHIINGHCRSRFGYCLENVILFSRLLQQILRLSFGNVFGCVLYRIIYDIHYN